MKKKVFTGPEAAALIKDGDSVLVSGFVGFGVAEEILSALEQRYLETGSPRNLTVIAAAGVGDVSALVGERGTRGFNHFAHEGMVKRIIIGHMGQAPKLGVFVAEEKVECFMLPQGVIAHLVRAGAGGKPGIITHVGLGTFIDPRLQGGAANECTARDMVELIVIGGQEKLFYKTFKVDVSIIRGTTADENGNISLEHEALFADPLSTAMIARNNGGIVLAQVARMTVAHQIKAQQVKIPAYMVDVLVKGRPEHHLQSYFYPDYHPELSGEVRIPLDDIPSLPLDMRKVCARRGAMELFTGAIVNLGLGVPDAVGSVASEEGIKEEDIYLTIESGAMGGIPMGGSAIGSSINVEAILDQGYQFDFYDGGGLDLAYLGLAQVDKKGNINVSKFDGRVVGPGGFINISQNAKKMVFCGTFTAGGLKADVGDGKLILTQEGKTWKFVDEVEHVTFSGEYAMKNGQEVLYITERAVFKLTHEGLVLTEIAPGVSLQEDVLDKMGFEPIISPNLTVMDERIFTDALMGLTLQQR
jgi:propionate CoA-transferase